MDLSGKKKWGIAIGSAMLVLLIIWGVRHDILRGLGNYLAYQNDLQEVEVIVVLAGSPLDRANEAARRYEEGWSDQVITTGGQVPHDFAVMDIHLKECDLTAYQLIRQGVPDQNIHRIAYGSSTLEESDTVLQYCIQNEIGSVMIVSSTFHTRRIKRFFQTKFEQAGIDISIRGASSSLFDLNTWWENEYGLLAVNNEYVKLLYYLLKGY